MHNVPSFAERLDATLDVDGLGTLTVDTAYGGDSFVIVDAEKLGFALVADEACDLVATGVKITQAANRQLGFTHPERPDWNHISFTLFAGPLGGSDGKLEARSAVVVQPGKIDRSPTGTALSARMAVLHARGVMKIGDRLTVKSIIDSTFQGQVVAAALVGETDAIVPSVSGRAWITGTSTLMLDPSDPWPGGYRISDTWPVKLWHREVAASMVLCKIDGTAHPVGPRCCKQSFFNEQSDLRYRRQCWRGHRILSSQRVPGRCRRGKSRPEPATPPALRAPHSSQEREFVERTFTNLHTGAFGKDLPDNWMHRDDAYKVFVKEVRDDNDSQFSEYGEWPNVHATW